MKPVPMTMPRQRVLQQLPPAPSPHSTAEPLSAQSFIYTTTYSSPQTYSGINNDQPFTKKIQTYTTPYYITGTSDSDLKYYARDNSGSYVCWDATYSISGTTLTITFGSTLRATITSATSFTVQGYSESRTDTGGLTTTDTEGNLVFTEGSAPSTWTYSLSYANE